MREEGKEQENKEQKISISRPQRNKLSDVVPKPGPPSVSAGTIDRVVDLAFNPSRDKIREMTSIDRIQGRLLPQLDVLSMMWQYIIGVAFFRQDADEYKRVFKEEMPLPPDIVGEFTYRTAQWQKSVQGMNLRSAVDLALAEVETRGEEDKEFGADAWKD